MVAPLHIPGKKMSQRDARLCREVRRWRGQGSLSHRGASMSSEAVASDDRYFAFSWGGRLWLCRASVSPRLLMQMARAMSARRPRHGRVVELTWRLLNEAIVRSDLFRARVGAGDVDNPAVYRRVVPDLLDRYAMAPCGAEANAYAIAKKKVRARRRRCVDHSR